MSTQTTLTLRERALEAAHAQRVAQETAERERVAVDKARKYALFSGRLHDLLGDESYSEQITENANGDLRYITGGVVWGYVPYGLAVVLPCSLCGEDVLTEFSSPQNSSWLIELGNILENAQNIQHHYLSDEACPANDRESALRNERLRSANAVAHINEQAQDRTAAEDLVQALRAALGL